MKLQPKFLNNDIIINEAFEILNTEKKKPFSSNIILLIKIKDLNTNPCKNSHSF